MPKNLKNSHGFSLLEVIIIAGMLGGLSLLVMSITKNMTGMTAKFEARSNEFSLMNAIQTNLLSQDACTNTFQGINATPGSTFSLIKDKLGNTVLTNAQGGVQFSGGKIISTTFNCNSTPAYPCTGQLVAGFNFTRTSALLAFKNSPAEKNTITLSVTIPSVNGAITSCYGDVSSTISTATSSACVAIGGTYDSASSVCHLKNITNAFTSPQDYFALSSPVADARYLQLTGGTISGAMAVGSLSSLGNIQGASVVSSGDAYANSSKILATQDWVNTAIYNNLTGTQKDAILTAIVNSTSSQTGINALAAYVLGKFSGACTTGQFMTGLTAGVPVCAAAVKANQVCTGTDAVTGVSALGVIICGAGGGGSSTCPPQTFWFTTTRTCAPSGTLTSGGFTCPGYTTATQTRVRSNGCSLTSSAVGTIANCVMGTDPQTYSYPISINTDFSCIENGGSYPSSGTVTCSVNNGNWSVAYKCVAGQWVQQGASPF
jgi:hypothetical protein